MFSRECLSGESEIEAEEKRVERDWMDHFTMPAAATEVTRSKISDLAGRTEEVLLLLVKDNEDLR